MPTIHKFGNTMLIKPIKTDADYRAALENIESLMMAGPETKHFPMELPGPITSR